MTAARRFQRKQTAAARKRARRAAKTVQRAKAMQAGMAAHQRRLDREELRRLQRAAVLEARARG